MTGSFALRSVFEDLFITDLTLGRMPLSWIPVDAVFVGIDGWRHGRADLAVIHLRR
jgi:hypothetical protein